MVILFDDNAIKVIMTIILIIPISIIFELLIKHFVKR